MMECFFVINYGLIIPAFLETFVAFVVVEDAHPFFFFFLRNILTVATLIVATFFMTTFHLL